jgi:hypothetical protein
MKLRDRASLSVVRHKIGKMMERLILLLLLACSDIHALLNSLNPQPFGQRQQQRSPSSSRIILQAGTSEKPLYDGTNYTFPDTTTPAGIAEVLEVSFVDACMQLRSGYVDVLKMFIAASMASYEIGFSIEEIQKELNICPKQTANRPLMKEEVDLRHAWYCLVHMTLASIGHPTRVRAVAELIPDEIRETYRDSVEQVAIAHKNGESISAEELVGNLNPGLSEIERAIRSQSLRVVALTLVVLNESMEAREGGAAPPTPPIEGAFD